MSKRIVTKIGDIFRVWLDNGNQRFFQYVANDVTCLNSSVIRVFKKEYPADYSLKAEEIVEDEVDFYAHTVLKAGIVENAWEKVGKSPKTGDTEHIMFRMYEYNATDHKDRIWAMWQINKDEVIIGKLTEHYRKCSDIGLVFSYLRIVGRIKTGKYPGSHFNADEH